MTDQKTPYVGKLDDNMLIFLLGDLPVEVVIRDRDSRIVYANEAFAFTYGCKAKDVIGRLDCELWIENGRTTEEAERWLGEDQKILSSGKRIEYIERIEREDGEIVYFHNIKQRMEFPGGSEYLLAVYYDITDQDLLEENLHRIQLKAAEYEGVHKTAVTYAHKINSPLSGILGLAQLLIERDDIPDDAKQMLDEVKQAAGSITEVVEKMVSITNPKTIKYTGETLRIDEDSI